MTALPPAPPTRPETRARPPDRGVWPQVIGTIAIVFGALGILGGLYGVVAPMFADFFLRLVPRQQGAAIRGMMEEMRIWGLVNSLAMVAIAALLLAGGVALVRRRRHARRLTVAWAVLKIVHVLFTTFLAYRMQAAQFAALQSPSGGVVLPGSFYTGIGVFSLVLAVLWGAALPVFMLVWFWRPRVRAGVAAWS